MATVWLVPAGTDSADGAAAGDYLLRPQSGDLYEIGRVEEGCTWVGTLSASLLPDLPRVDSPREAPEQERVLTAAQGVESAEHMRGG